MFWLATKTLRTKSYSLVECQRMMFFIKKKKLILKLKCFMNVEQRVLLGQYRRVYIYLLHRAHRFKGKRRDEHKKNRWKSLICFCLPIFHPILYGIPSLLLLLAAAVAICYLLLSGSWSRCCHAFTHKYAYIIHIAINYTKKSFTLVTCKLQSVRSRRQQGEKKRTQK